jgi:hypothetical protein
MRSRWLSIATPEVSTEPEVEPVVLPVVEPVAVLVVLPEVEPVVLPPPTSAKLTTLAWLSWANGSTVTVESSIFCSSVSSQSMRCGLVRSFFIDVGSLCGGSGPSTPCDRQISSCLLE